MLYAIRKNRLAETLRPALAAMKPDVICLQEVQMAGKRGLVYDIAEEFGYYIFFSPRARMRMVGRSIGLAILTKRIPEQTSCVVLPHSLRRRPRIIQTVVCEVGGRRWRIANTHLGHPYLASFKSRCAQLGAVFDVLQDSDSDSDQSMPTVLAGDFNTKTKKEVAVFAGLLAGQGFQVSRVLPYSSHILRMRWKFDWIAVRNADLVATGILNEVEGSDHKPVWADITYHLAER